MLKPRSALLATHLMLALLIFSAISVANTDQCILGLAEKVDYTNEVMDSLSSTYSKVNPALRSGYSTIDVKMAMFAEKIGVDAETVFSAFRALRNKISFYKTAEAFTATKLMFKYQKSVDEMVSAYTSINQGVSFYTSTHRTKLVELALQEGGEFDLVKNGYNFLRSKGGYYNSKKELVGLLDLAIKNKRIVSDTKDIFDQVRGASNVYGSQAIDITKAVIISKKEIGEVLQIYTAIRNSSVVYSDYLGVVTVQAVTSTAPLADILKAYSEIRNASINSAKDRLALLSAFTKYGVKPENSIKVYQRVRSRFNNFSYDYGAITLHVIAEGYPIGIDRLSPEDLLNPTTE